IPYREPLCADLRHDIYNVCDLGAEKLLAMFDGRHIILAHVVEQAGRDRNVVQLQLDEEFGDGEGMNEVGFAGAADMSPVFERGKDVGTAKELQIGVWAVGSDLVEQVLKSDHCGNS